MRNQRRGAFAVLVATHGVNDFYTGAIIALLPYFVAERHYDYAAVAGITLAATALSSVTQPVFGYLSDRFSMRWIVVVGVLVAGAGVSVSGLFAGNYAAVWIVAALSGLAVAAYHPAATIAARVAGGGSNRSMSVFSVGGNIGVALAPSAVIVTVGVFGLHATPLLFIPAVAVAVLVALRGIPRVATSGGKAARVSTASSSDSWGRFAVLLAVVAFWSVAYVSTSSFIALYTVQRFGVSPSVASIPLSLFPAAGAVGTIGGGWLADRFGRLRTIRIGYAAAALAAAGILVSPTPLLVTIATAILGCALFLPFAPQITLSHSYLPRRVGMASGVTLGMSLSLGGFISPALGALADATSVQVVFAVVAACLVLGFAIALLLRERRTLSLEAAELVASDPHDAEAKAK
jgi:MFS transporter, FSR family, fosmidomycin resistance protein